MSPDVRLFVRRGLGRWQKPSNTYANIGVDAGTILMFLLAIMGFDRQIAHAPV